MVRGALLLLRHVGHVRGALAQAPGAAGQAGRLQHQGLHEEPAAHDAAPPGPARLLPARHRGKSFLGHP